MIEAAIALHNATTDFIIRKCNSLAQ